MSGRSPYLRLEQQIAASDQGGAIARWKYGRRLLAEKRGHRKLPAGLLDSLVAEAERDGIKGVSRREIQYRMTFAEAYSTEAIANEAVRNLGSWGALRDAGFPRIEQPADQSVSDVDVPADEPAQPTLDGDTGDVFPALVPVGPGQRRPLGVCTIAQLEAYADEMERMTAGFVRRDSERRRRLTKLLVSVHGNRQATYAAAIAAELEASA